MDTAQAMSGPDGSLTHSLSYRHTSSGTAELPHATNTPPQQQQQKLAVSPGAANGELGASAQQNHSLSSSGGDADRRAGGSQSAYAAHEIASDLVRSMEAHAARDAAPPAGGAEGSSSLDRSAPMQPRSLEPAQQRAGPASHPLHIPSAGSAAPPEGELATSPPGRPVLPKAGSARPPRPPAAAGSPAKQASWRLPAPDLDVQQGSPEALPSPFLAALGPSGRGVTPLPRNALEERIARGSFASASSSSGRHQPEASSPKVPVSSFEQRLLGPGLGSLPHSSSVDAPRGGAASNGAGLGAGQLYSAAVPTQDTPPPFESLLVMSVSEEGYVWQWDVPLQALFEDEEAAPAFPSAATALPSAFSCAPPSKTANSGAAAATACTRPRLLGLLQTLPHSVTTFSVCPVAVAVGMLGAGGGPPSASSGNRPPPALYP
jgi:hypothetical protein